MSLAAAVRPREPLTVREWDVLRLEQFGDRRAFEELHAWALGDEGRKVLEAGLGKVRVLNYVGVLMTRSGFVLEILPKTEEGRPAQESRELLLHMLGRSGLVPSLGGQSAPAQTARLPLSEWLVNLFFESVVALVKRGLSSSYETMEADLPCVRGRINFNIWAGRGIPKDRIPCGFDHLSPNSRENRILATALRICVDAGLGGGKVQRMRFLDDAFEEIESFPSPATALQALRGLGVDRK